MKKLIFLIILVFFMTGCTPDYSSIHDNTLDDIKALNDGVMPEIEYGADGIPTAIGGKYSDIKVHSPDDAKKSLYSIKTLMKFNDPKNEFKLDMMDKTSTPYLFSFDQVFNKIIVYGKGLEIATDENGTIIDIGGDYDVNLNLDSTPKITKKEAQDIAEKSFGGEASEPESIFWAIDKYEESPVLTWKMDMGNAYQIVYVNAYNGEIVYNESTMLDD